MNSSIDNFINSFKVNRRKIEDIDSDEEREKKKEEKEESNKDKTNESKIILPKPIHRPKPIQPMIQIQKDVFENSVLNNISKANQEEEVILNKEKKSNPLETDKVDELRKNYIDKYSNLNSNNYNLLDDLNLDEDDSQINQKFEGNSNKKHNQIEECVNDNANNENKMNINIMRKENNLNKRLNNIETSTFLNTTSYQSNQSIYKFMSSVNIKFTFRPNNFSSLYQTTLNNQSILIINTKENNYKNIKIPIKQIEKSISNEYFPSSFTNRNAFSNFHDLFTKIPFSQKDQFEIIACLCLFSLSQREKDYKNRILIFDELKFKNRLINLYANLQLDFDKNNSISYVDSYEKVSCNEVSYMPIENIILSILTSSTDNTYSLIESYFNMNISYKNLDLFIIFLIKSNRIDKNNTKATQFLYEYIENSFDKFFSSILNNKYSLSSKELSTFLSQIIKNGYKNFSFFTLSILILSNNYIYNPQIDIEILDYLINKGVDYISITSLQKILYTEFVLFLVFFIVNSNSFSSNKDKNQVNNLYDKIAFLSILIKLKYILLVTSNIKSIFNNEDSFTYNELINDKKIEDIKSLAVKVYENKSQFGIISKKDPSFEKMLRENMLNIKRIDLNDFDYVNVELSSFGMRDSSNKFREYDNYSKKDNKKITKENDKIKETKNINENHTESTFHMKLEENNAQNQLQQSISTEIKKPELSQKIKPIQTIKKPILNQKQYTLDFFNTESKENDNKDSDDHKEFPKDTTTINQVLSPSKEKINETKSVSFASDSQLNKQSQLSNSSFFVNAIGFIMKKATNNINIPKPSSEDVKMDKQKESVKEEKDGEKEKGKGDIYYCPIEKRYLIRGQVVKDEEEIKKSENIPENIQKRLPPKAVKQIEKNEEKNEEKVENKANQIKSNMNENVNSNPFAKNVKLPKPCNNLIKKPVQKYASFFDE